MSERDEEATIDATPHRREQARQQGRIVRSQELVHALGLLGAIAVIAWRGRALANWFGSLAVEQLGGKAWLAIDNDSAASWAQTILLELATLLLPLLLLFAACALAANLVQTGVRFLPERLFPDLQRVDPLAGMTRIFSWAHAGRSILGIVKLAIFCAVAYSLAASELPSIAALAKQTAPQVAAFLAGPLLWMLMKLCGALIAVGLLDYALAWWLHERALRMTPQELREEMKSLQPNNRITARRRKGRQAASMVTTGSLSAAEPVAR